MAQQCVRPKGDPRCPFHPKHIVILRCNECPGNTLVCQLCITSIHKGHTFGDIQDGITEKVENIKQFIQKTETLTIPQLTTELTSLEKKKAKTTEMFQSEIQTARDQAAKLRELVELQMTKTVSSLEYDMKDALMAIDNYQTQLKQLKSKLEEEMKATKTAITSDNDILLQDTENDIMKKTDDCIPQCPDISVPHFLPCTNPLPHVEKAFGNLEKKKAKPQNIQPVSTAASLAPPMAFSSSSDQTKHKTGTSKFAAKVDQSYTKQQKKRILDKPIVVSSFLREYGADTICLISSSTAWIHEFKEPNSHITLISDKGREQKTMSLGTKVRLICLHPSTGDMYGCCQDDKSVIHINTEEEQTTVLFHTETKPWSIACTINNVIVGMEEKVTMYTYKGKVVCSKDIGKYYYAYHISVCNRTNRVAVACGFKGVLVLDSTLNVLYTYTGEGVAAAGTVQREKFNTFCAVFDDNGYLLVGDYDNKEVHILDGTAKYISTIKTKDMAEVWTLGVYHGVVWVGCTTGKQHKIVCVK